MSKTRRTFLAFSGGVLIGTVAGCLDVVADDSDRDRDDGHSERDHDDEDSDHDDDDSDHDHDDGYSDHDHDDGGYGSEVVSNFEVIDRGEDERTAYVHGDHWHGELPAVTVGDTLSLGAFVEDPDGEEIALGTNDEFELRVREADGEPEDVVDFDYHGDHVHVEGLEAGIVDVVFQLWHDDHADYETPPIDVRVVEEERDQ